MKKWLLVPAVSLLALSACGSDETDNSSESVNVDGDEQTEQNTEVDSETEDTENEADENGDTASADEGEDEEVEVVYEINPNMWTVEPIEGTDADPEVVLLTIDDAPDKHGVEMAETLKELDAPAIFFVNAHFINTDEKADELKQIHEMGFEIGNHTMSHPNLREISEEEQYNEIVGLNDKIEDIIGERPRFFRAPFGANTDYVKEVVEQEDMTLMNWTYGYDFTEGYMTEEAIADIMVNAPELGNGGNLLMHDREWTNAALEDIVTGLQDKGYGFVDPDQLK
ncbi:polysaccharide deacetylase family protein [Alkalihalobacillus sp. LMS6]|uniref:polysaccharide deacetylase family protein n=1 Tax=Alkalihalobacillus sp. LMS6 TaxID=2924034 RepID=UPI0020D06604|nr:polysaccharide deacetylase family protein [Alkalihalobacillus sp. LMS6]UTR04901.1 polysaccharide deacetylase family protein [Alkalihalobacillus sp. LMS6]